MDISWVYFCSRNFIRKSTYFTDFRCVRLLKVEKPWAIHRRTNMCFEWLQTAGWLSIHLASVLYITWREARMNYLPPKYTQFLIKPAINLQDTPFLFGALPLECWCRSTTRVALHLGTQWSPSTCLSSVLRMKKTNLHNAVLCSDGPTLFNVADSRHHFMSLQMETKV